ncbi:MAG: LysE family transporter [Cyclobacteriaceae bacterium]
MSPISVLLVAMTVSFVGSIPPGTINISVMQLAIKQRRSAAIAFGAAAALVELFYAGFTVRFHIFLTENTGITDYFHLIAGTAMITLGFLNLKSKTGAKDVRSVDEEVRRRNAFRKGVILGIANPLTVPFWLAVTAYLQKHQWITLDGYNLYAYSVGIAIGTFILLLIVTQLGSKFRAIADNRLIVHIIPGTLFILMGLYSYYQYILTF